MTVLSEHSSASDVYLDSKCSRMSHCRHDGVGRRHDARGDVGGDAGTAVSRRPAQSSRVGRRPVGRVARRLRVHVGPSVRLVRAGVGSMVVCRGALGRVGGRFFGRCVGPGQRAARPGHRMASAAPGTGLLPVTAGRDSTSSNCQPTHIPAAGTASPRESWGPWFAASSDGRSTQRHPPSARSSSLCSEIMPSRRCPCFAVAGGPCDPACPDLPVAGGAPPDRGSSVPGCGAALSLHCRGRGG